MQNRTKILQNQTFCIFASCKIGHSAPLKAPETEEKSLIDSAIAEVGAHPPAVCFPGRLAKLYRRGLENVAKRCSFNSFLQLFRMKPLQIKEKRVSLPANIHFLLLVRT